jgi:uncharacterized tellurite resistance protein B-like protein
MFDNLNLDQKKLRLIEWANLFYNGKEVVVSDQVYDELESEIIRRILILM